jgi:hypothetical protein
LLYAQILNILIIVHVVIGKACCYYFERPLTGYTIVWSTYCLFTFLNCQAKGSFHTRFLFIIVSLQWNIHITYFFGYPVHLTCWTKIETGLIFLCCFCASPVVWSTLVHLTLQRGFYGLPKFARCHSFVNKISEITHSYTICLCSFYCIQDLQCSTLIYLVQILYLLIP